MSAVFYDRREQRKIQQKWCDKVAHLALEPLATNHIPRKVMIYLSAPPGDNLRPAREHFREYVKPILVSAAIDYEVIEGRREGDVRAQIAERIRSRRTKAGEAASGLDSTSEEQEDIVEVVKAKFGVVDSPERGGDIVIGRHTWKEYIRGLHEGWLGPLAPPPEPKPEEAQPPQSTLEDPLTSQTSDSPESTAPEEPEKKDPPPPPSKLKKQPPPFNTPPYTEDQISPSITRQFDPALPLSFVHLLGFLNTPVRFLDFVQKRYVAEHLGSQVAAFILNPEREFTTQEPTKDERSWLEQTWTRAPNREHSSNLKVENYNQEQLYSLVSEEPWWHKSSRTPQPEDEVRKERPWTDLPILDERITSRMRTIDLNQAIDSESETSKAVETARIDGYYRRVRGWHGGADPETPLGWVAWIKKSFGAHEPPKAQGWIDGRKESGDDM